MVAILRSEDKFYKRLLGHAPTHECFSSNMMIHVCLSANHCECISGRVSPVIVVYLCPCSTRFHARVPAREQNGLTPLGLEEKQTPRAQSSCIIVPTKLSGITRNTYTYERPIRTNQSQPDITCTWMLRVDASTD
ncbi:hypothetical protein RRG08_027452 [Elysia crispata]|uniref:Uncharacterized protein n=1 Tax=Elysia crispata TaxID=231223 RepID=A0AAE1D3N7_9GAST|nr:hypothetical protein RRG08_027452 [Elysia crispata]